MKLTKQERLLRISEHYAGGNKAELARRLKLQKSAISGWLERDSYNAELLLDTFPDLSAEWLMRGTEPMLLSELKQKEADTASVDLHQALDLIKSQAQTIQNLHTLLDHYLEDTKPKDTL